MNQNIALGGLMFILWGTFSTWYYTCQVKGLCMDAPPAISITREEPTESQPILTEDSVEVLPGDTVPVLPPIDLAESGILFTKNTTKLTSEQVLRTFLSSARDRSKGREVKVAVTGHTCDLGSEAHNEQLGMERAQSVKGYLQEYGFGEGQTSYASMGENSPLLPNDSEESRTKNRRVEITIKSTDQ